MICLCAWTRVGSPLCVQCPAVSTVVSPWAFPASLTVCQRSGQTQDSRSPSGPRLCPLDQSASGASLLRVQAAGWMVIMVQGASLSSQPVGTGRGAAERCVGLRKGGLSGPSRLCDTPSPPAPQGAVRPWRGAWPQGSGEGTDTGWEPPVCGDPPLRPPAALRPQRPRHHFTDEGTGVHRCWVTGSGSHSCRGQEGPEAKVPSPS